MRTAILELTADEYHRDELPGVTVPALSSSIASVLDSRSPAHAFAAHPKLGGTSRPPSESMDEGTALHSMVLGVGRQVVPLAFDDYRTKAAKEARDAARAEGSIPLRAKDYDRVAKAANRLRERLRGFELAGDHEQTLLWVEQADDGTEVQCKAMLDLVDFRTGRIVDLKSCDDASPRHIERAVEDYGYAIQDHAYRRAFEANRPELAGRVSLTFLFLERSAPFAVTPVTLDGSWRHIGESRWRRAVNTWARCLRAGVWPDYGPALVGPPGYVMAREEARELSESGPEGRAA